MQSLPTIGNKAETASISTSKHKLSCSLQMKLNTFNWVVSHLCILFYLSLTC